jgi:6-phosphofructokinase 1
MLGTARTNPAKNPAHMAALLKGLADLKVKYLVTIGGDDTAYSGSQVYAQAGGKIKVAHVPKTIDNDLPLPPGIPTFGFQTARHLGALTARALHEDARTTGRWYIVVSMGRAAGHLALGIGKASAATLTLISEEYPFDPSTDPNRKGKRLIALDDICRVIVGSMVKRKVANRNYGLVVLAEGLLDNIGEEGLKAVMTEEEISRYGKIVKDPFGHLRLGELDFGRMVRDRLETHMKPLGLKTTMVAKDLGYELRCADPIPFDVEYTRDLGYGAVKFLMSPDAAEYGAIVSVVGGELKPLRFQDMIVPETKRMKPREVETDHVTYECARRYMTRLEKSDFDDTDQLAALAKEVKLSPAEFKAKFGSLVA